MGRALLSLLCSAALALAQIPPLGPLTGGLRPLSNPTFSIHHCQYVASFSPTDAGDEDYSWQLTLGLSGVPGTHSFESSGFPGFYLGIKDNRTGALGLINPPADGSSAAAATFALVAPLAPPPPGTPSVFSLQSQAGGGWHGRYVTFAESTAAPCAFPAPSGDAMLTDATGMGPRATFLLGAAAPQAPLLASVATRTITNPSVNRRFMGCHHDYGFAQAPRGFLGNLLYGSSFEKGTQGVPSWLPHALNATGPPPALADASSFSGKPSMSFTLDSSAGESGLKNRGIGGAGLSLAGGRPYTVQVYIWSGGSPGAFVELYDFTTNTSLARADFAVVSTGPDWGSTWLRYNFTLTPSASTACTGIAFGSDPAIDCGSSAGPAHVCVRCGGELRLGISSKGNFKVGYVELMPGAWGLLASKRGPPIPVLKSAGDVLVAMGTSLMRNGGSVSQSMRWKDWRGPVWNRPSQQQAWGNSLLSGWGPFDYIELAEALDLEPVLTLAYDLNDALDFADLVEYCWGAPSTSWGARRAADRGHDGVYNVTVFELGNEQYNPSFVEQVLAMEAASAAVASPPLRYMFPSNSGLNAADAARLLAAAPSVVPRILADLHVGAGGAVEAAAGLFANPPTPGFAQGAINAETNAGTHGLQRALDEAADLIDWFTADVAVTGRLYARTASFCTGSSNNFDSQWDQGISFFLPNMTWLQPPGHVHAMIAATWAESTLQSTLSGTQAPFAAQKTADGKSLVLRVVNNGDGALPLQVQLLGGDAAAGPAYTLWTLGGQGLSRGADNTPSAVDAVAPKSASVPIAAGALGLNLTIEATQFAVLVVALQ